MNNRLATSIVFLLAIPSCTRQIATNVRVEMSPPQISPTQPAPTHLTASTVSEWQRHLGEIVMLHGKFSLFGRIAPYIMVRDEEIYIKPQGSFGWDVSYTRLEGRDVRVTGILRFAQHNQLPTADLTHQREYDYYYFDAESAKIELNR